MQGCDLGYGSFEWQYHCGREMSHVVVVWADRFDLAGAKVKQSSSTSAWSHRELVPARTKEMLLREMQHRVAKRLQVVASILSLKARAVKSEEVRLHLSDACNRVMWIAAVQRQLLASRHSSAIRIDEYLSELSEGLAASLTAKVKLSVFVDGTATLESNKAVKIGLVMTELIINAIKHAFPQKRRGRIIVAYNTAGSDWSLSVSDNGVGLPNPSRSGSHSGYGTRIVDTLAKELDAQVSVKGGPRAHVCHSSIRPAQVRM